MEMTEKKRAGGRECPEQTRGGKSRPVLSVFALYVRSSAYKITAVLGCMTLAEAAVFLAVCDSLEACGGWVNPERMIDLCHLRFIFLAALAAVYFFLLISEDERGGSMSSYTLSRLKISERSQFAVRTVYNVLCLILTFAVQILAAFVLCRLYQARLPVELISPQYLFLTFYRNDFLHCILPLADVWGWVINGLLMLALGMDAASTLIRYGGRGVKGFATMICVGVLLANWFMTGFGWAATLWCGGLFLFIITGVLIQIFRKSRQRP